MKPRLVHIQVQREAQCTPHFNARVRQRNDFGEYGCEKAPIRAIVHL